MFAKHDIRISKSLILRSELTTFKISSRNVYNNNRIDGLWVQIRQLIGQHLGHYLNLYNNTFINAIVNAVSNISYMTLLEAADTGRCFCSSFYERT